MTLPKGFGTIRTHTPGVYLDLLHPDPDLISLEDIAWSLARINRWTGHTRSYSVAEHCVYVSCIAPEPLRPWALLHDAEEYATGDCASPLKMLLRGIPDLPEDVRRELRAELSPELWQFLYAGLPGYRSIQDGWARAVSARFGVPIEHIKQWDREALLAERRDLLGIDEPWIEDGMGYVAYPVPVRPLGDPTKAERLYLRRAWELGIR